MKGKTRRLWPCTLQVLNYSSQSIPVKPYETWGFKVKIGDMVYPLYPLCQYADEFNHPGALSLLNHCFPKDKLPKSAWTTMPLAARFLENAMPETMIPEVLYINGGNNNPISWVRAEPGALKSFLSCPSQENLKFLAKLR